MFRIEGPIIENVNVIHNVKNNRFNDFDHSDIFMIYLYFLFYFKIAERINLMTRKGVYPYEYMDSFERFNETSLPSKDKFYSSLTDDGIEDREYAHAHNVWNTFQMKTMRDYHDLYLITDTLLLADVFEEFRKMCLENYKLDPVHSYTAPGLSWQAALRMTNVELDLLTDIDQHLFIEEGIRGGVAMISHRYVTFICNTYMIV